MIKTIIDSTAVTNIVERIECAIRLIGDYELSGGSAVVSSVHEWGILREEIEILKQILSSGIKIDD